MFNEKINLSNKEEEGLKNTISLIGEEVKFNRNIKGEFKDTIRYVDGRVVERKWERNCIVNSICNLIACLFKVQASTTGLNYWAVGSGADTWDDINPPVATATDTKCVNEIGRLAITPANMTFVDTNGNVTASITNRIKITLDFGVNDCNGTWREFAIFGGNATSTKDSGIAINHKTHGVIVKTNQMSIERQIIFTFN